MLIDLLDLSKRSGLGISVLLCAFRGGLEPILLDFALFSGMTLPKGTVAPSLIRQWTKDFHLTPCEIDIEIAELLKDQIEEHFSRRFGVVGFNPTDRDQGTGFAPPDPKSRFGSR